MKLELAPGKYVVAVSGGVDSVVLLDLLVKQAAIYHLPSTNNQLVVAHYDHGIRPESGEDRKFVEGLAKKYGLPFEYAEGNLGPDASEALARQKRYEFLDSIRFKYDLNHILTAHHQDDLLETAIINLLRGTGRRGLTALKSTDVIKRPLLSYSKQQIKDYALKNKLTWHEDPTNVDTKYLRNYVRHEVLPRLDRQKLLDIVTKESDLNQSIDNLLAEVLVGGNKIDRKWFASLPSEVGREVMAAWLRQNGIRNYDKKALERLVRGAKNPVTGKRYDVNGTSWLVIEKHDLALASKER